MIASDHTDVDQVVRIRLKQFPAQGNAGVERGQRLGEAPLANVKPADREINIYQIGLDPNIGGAVVDTLLALREPFSQNLQ